MALLRRPPVEGGRHTIFHVSVSTGVLISYIYFFSLFYSSPSLREPVALQKIYAFTLYPACSFLLTASSMSAFTLRRLALARLAGVAVGNGRREAQRARGGRATAPAAAAAPGGPTGPC